MGTGNQSGDPCKSIMCRNTWATSPILRICSFLEQWPIVMETIQHYWEKTSHLSKVCFQGAKLSSKICDSKWFSHRYMGTQDIAFYLPPLKLWLVWQLASREKLHSSEHRQDVISVNRATSYSPGDKSLYRQSDDNVSLMLCNQDSTSLLLPSSKWPTTAV